MEEIKVKFDSHTGEIILEQSFKEGGFKREDKRTWKRSEIKKLYFNSKKELENLKKDIEETKIKEEQYQKGLKARQEVSEKNLKLQNDLIKTISKNYPVDTWENEKIINKDSKTNKEE